MARRPMRPPRRRRSRRSWIILLVLVVAAIAAYLYFTRHSAFQPADDTGWVQQVRAAEADVRGDPNVADLVHSRGSDQWDVTPANASVKPQDFARYICFLIDRAGVAGPRTSVRAIDGAALKARDFDYDAATRATVRCMGEEPQ